MAETSPIAVLVIEDNQGDFLLIKDYLEEQFAEVKTIHAKRFAEAKAILENLTIQLDVILLDLTLPDHTGEDLIKDVVNLRIQTPIIVLTGFADLEFSVKSLSLKISDYLLKDDINAASLYKSIKFNIERKKTNLLLEESEKRYSNLFQLSPQPMWIFDIENYSFLQVNKAAIDHYQYTESEFLNMKLNDILADVYDEKDNIVKANEISLNEQIYKGRFRHRKKNKKIIEVDIYSSLITINEISYESVIAIDVTEKIKLEHKITKAIITTQEDERYEIGTELHDNVCQILASSQLSLEMLRDNLPPESVQWFNKSKQFINLALDEIRNISHRLAPSFFDETTLDDTFQELLDNFNTEKKYLINLDIDFGKVKKKLSSEIQLNLYRILQEQMRNIVKYAHASKIKVSLLIEANKIVFQIEDDGVGFDYRLAKRGIGLANIRRRTELFSGKMEIITKINEGCKLVVQIPI
jgi:PAS domain S-box-containing protein